MVGTNFQLDRIQITWEMGLHACLWGIILIMLIETGRPAYCRLHHLLDGILDWINGEREERSSMHPSLPLSSCEFSVTSWFTFGSLISL